MVASLMRATGHDGLADPARLLVSEVVTNVHLHTDVAKLQLVATVHPEWVLISVEDRAPRAHPRTPPPGGPRHPDPHAEGGRGLMLVQECAHAWGITWHGGLEPTGKRVWFELRDAPGPGGEASRPVGQTPPQVTDPPHGRPAGRPGKLGV
ncbi:ATP-binding protein [Streptomyces sp. NPDC003077]|uniref:ATP-binding protein n=1 Tax=Streptomyces sp. NPDC003077 TaxID=3154443 RepID=UPI00339F14B8